MAARRAILRFALLSLLAFVGMTTCTRPPAPVGHVAAATATRPGTLTEDEKIERLIAAITQIPNAKFIRKDVEYDASTADTFLRGKRDWMKDQVKTARDFVEMASAGNLGTGAPYYIKYPDGRRVPGAGVADGGAATS